MTIKNLSYTMEKMPRFIQILISTISFLFVLSPVYAQTADKQDLIDFNLHYSNNIVTIKSIERRQGFIPNLSPGTNSYKLTVFGQNNNELSSVGFVFPSAVTNRTGDTVILKDADTTVTTKFFPEASSVKIFDPQNKEVASQSLSFVVNPISPKPIVEQKSTQTNSNLAMIGFIALAIVCASFLVYKIIRTRSNTPPPTPPIAS